MALPVNIDELIENKVVESTCIEYKANWDPEPIIHSITAFANDIDNSGGGYIVVGVEEENGMPKTPITGLTKGSVDYIQKELLNKCNLHKPNPTGFNMRERIFRGPLDKQLRDALEYIRNSIIEEYVTKVPDSAEAVRIFNWPYRAVEEALSNAVYVIRHRHIIIAGGRGSVRIKEVGMILHEFIKDIFTCYRAEYTMRFCT